jgi:hypothetical protein
MTFDYLSWKRQTHSLMKQSISHMALCTSMNIGIKWFPLWSLLYLWILVMALSFATAPIHWFITLIAIISCVRLITTILITKTWSSWVYQKLVHNETPNVMAYHHSFHWTCPLSRRKAYMMSLMVSCMVICWPSNGCVRCVLDVCQMHLIFVYTHMWKD